MKNKIKSYIGKFMHNLNEIYWFLKKKSIKHKIYANLVSHLLLLAVGAPIFFPADF